MKEELTFDCMEEVETILSGIFSFANGPDGEIYIT